MLLENCDCDMNGFIFVIYSRFDIFTVQRSQSWLNFQMGGLGKLI